MKLDRSTMAMALALAFACGCSATTSRPAPYASYAPQAAVASNVAGTTNLMSAELPGPAPKVGKAHLAIDETAFDTDTTSNDESTPKEARRSDGSHRGGSFGTSSK